jgi:SAM-dependent methyltransferase
MDDTLSKKNTWFPTPRYLCRKDVVLSFLDEINKGAFLEVGIGTGDLVLELAKRGYKGLGIEISDEAVEMSGEKLKNVNSDIRVEKKDLFEVNESFDIVIMLEVIEHIKDDIEALRKVYSLLNKDGYFIVSAPAHKKKWSFASDELAGHYRRYEKNEIRSKLEEVGFRVLKSYNYGFPIANIAAPIRNYLMTKDNQSKEYKKMNTERSGIDRNSQKKFAFLVNEFTMAPFLFLQKFFLDKDLSDGYVVLTQK